MKSIFIWASDFCIKTDLKIVNLSFKAVVACRMGSADFRYLIHSPLVPESNHRTNLSLRVRDQTLEEDKEISPTVL